MVVLILMPFVPLEHPSLGVSVIKSCLQAAGIPSSVRYGNLEFAQRLGSNLSNLLKHVPNDLLLGEWIFSGAAFGHDFPDQQAYLESLHRYVSPQQWPELRAARQLAAEFVEEVARELVATGVRVLGASSMFSQNCATLALLQRVKQLDPSVVTVMGGSNCEGEMGRAMVDNFDFVDFAFSGESENVVGEFFQSLLLHGSDLPQLPAGVIARNGGPVQRLVLNDMDSSPVPDFSDYFKALEELPLGRQINPGLLVETSRGCWWGQTHHCTFCGLNGHGMNFRSKSPGRAIQEFAELAERYQIRKFEAVDNILARGYFEEVLPAFAGANYEIFYEIKANLKKEQVQALAEAGVRWLQPGLESLHLGPLKLMRKGTTPMTNLALLKWAREHGQWVVWNILCGFPGEEEGWYGEMADLVPLLSHLQPPQGLNPLRFDRYSPYYTQAADFGLQLLPSPAYRHVYPLPEAELARLAYYFVDPRRDMATFQGGEYARLRQALQGWKGEFKREVPAVLSAQDDGQELFLFDTRRVAKQRQRRLRGLAREILMACDRPASPSSLASALQRPWETLMPTVGELVEDHLLLWQDDRLMGLPVFGDLPSLPLPGEFPGGHFAA